MAPDGKLSERGPRRSPAITRLLPPQCVAYEVITDLVDARLLSEATLFPEEQIVIAEANPARRSEFAVVRLCARRALADLGSPPYPLVPGSRGAPRWPTGFVGSMTHCRGFAAAAVARSQDVRALGIDAEPHLPLPSEVIDRVAVGGERRHLADLKLLHPATHWDRLLFCAKEAVYKVWSPLTDTWLGFDDVQVNLEPQAVEDGGALTAWLGVPGPVLESGQLDTLHGRWALVAGRLLVAVWLLSPTEASFGRVAT